MSVGWISLAANVGTSLYNNKQAGDRADAANAAQQAGIQDANIRSEEARAAAITQLNPLIGVGDNQIPGIQSDIKTYRDAGTSGINTLGGLSNSNLDVGQFLDPSMRFALEQGASTIEKSAAARGMLHSGAALKELTKYATGLASTNYNNAVSQAMADRNSRAGIGGQLANIGLSGTQSAETLYGRGAAGRGAAANAELGVGSDLASLALASGNSAGKATAAQGNALSGIDLGKTINTGYDLWNKQAGGGGTSNLGGLDAADVYGAGSGWGQDVIDPNNPYSDSQLKKDIASANEAHINDFLSSIDPKTFEYNEEGQSLGAPAGEHTGVLAQDVEKSTIGKGLVKKDPDSGYKQIDIPQSVGALLASVAYLDKKVKRLEKR